MPLLPQCYCTLRHPHPDAVDKTESRTVRSLGAYRVQCKDTDIHAEAGESYRTVSGRTLIFFSTSFIMLKREVAVKLPAFVFVIDTLQHNRYN